MTFFKRMFGGLFVCALLLLGLGAAMAEDTLLEGQVELFSEGGLPKVASAPAATFALNSFEDYMLENLKKQAEEIDVSSYGFSDPEIAYLYGNLLNSHPEMFYVSGAYSYYTNGSIVTGIIPYYVYTGDELKRMQNVFNSGVSRVVNYASAASTDIGRLIRANDYLCANFEYDTSYSIYSPEVFFDEGKGVCQAYMLAFRAVLNRLGISSVSVVSDGMNHTWNMVYLDGSWYHIDVTWNDPTRDVPLRACHDNFLLSDAGIAATGHFGWTDGFENIPSADNQRYDSYFWREITQTMPMQGDVVYYADSDYIFTMRDVYSHNLATGTTRKIGSYDYGYGSYYTGYNPIWVYDGMLYYAVRDALYRMPLAGGAAELVYATGISDLWIWYPYQSSANLKMVISENPGVSGRIFSYEMKKTCLEHVPAQKDASDATCTQPGLTAGTYCTVCGEVITAQQEVPALGHDEGEWVIVIEASVDAEGLKEKRCTRCEAVLEEEIIPRIEEILRIPGDATGDGVVDGRDLIRLAKFLGGHDVDVDPAGASVNGDDIVDGRDLIRLAKYLGGHDVELE